ncbi:glycosyltransferase [Ideonella sp. 4Y11]|uniref:Glycosyltransferase n=1 Tax=Ideonella aquatica TaxID=2824119 RepID=A0A940YLD8_9BURK|nr:glycosyltransferase [Ideonella aquatica]MBQ0958441.1 glycosyltransferase [Ideonella aquatica]
MSHAPSTPFPQELASLLRRLPLAAAAGGPLEPDVVLGECPPALLDEPLTLAAALLAGGADLAEACIARRHPDLDASQRTALVAQVLCTLLDEAAGDAPPAWAAALAEPLSREADTLAESLRVRFLLDRGTVEELPQAIHAATSLHDWPLALHGVERLRGALGPHTPPAVYGLGATCLHHLHRFAEADRWVAEGLGPQARRIAALEPPGEDALFERWGGQTAPVVSIVCTTYNHERYIESAIRGFLGQDCPFPFEVLIHDDASTDGTQAVIRAWQQRYPRLIKPVLQTENQMSRGVRPFELLLARAQGEFVATCEGDDYWIRPDKLRYQIGFMRQHPDVSCTAHNYYHFAELQLAVRQWGKGQHNAWITAHQLMSVQLLLWLPTLVFRRHFSAMPPERALAAFGDQFLVSWLGTFGRGAYLDTFVGAVRRENEFSSWSPLPERVKEQRRVQTWVAIRRLHQRLGHAEVVAELDRRIAASPLDATTKAQLLARADTFHTEPALAA